MEIIIGAIAVCDYDVIVTGSANGYDFVSILMDVGRGLYRLKLLAAFVNINHARFWVCAMGKEALTLY